MKKLLTTACIAMLLSMAYEPVKAQIVVVEIIKAGVKKVIKAVDLQIQRIQNKTIWLQNAQKTLENQLTKLKLKEIGDWAEKQRMLYADYFDELSKVKAAISSYHAVRDIIDKQVQLVKEYGKAFNLSKRDKYFTQDEILYMEQVYSGILNESLKSLDQLRLVITAFATEMTDEKRLDVIHAADTDMDQYLTDLRQFNQQNTRVSLQRAKEKHDIYAVKQFYGLR